jgi:hypothetical protein
MASSTGYLPVDGPRPGAPRVSLLETARILGRVVEGTVPVTSAEDMPDEGTPDVLGSGERWVNGIAFRPTYCGAGGVLIAPCTEADLDLSERPTNVENQPLLADVFVDCSSMAELDREDAGRQAVDLLNVRQHGLIGSEFWTGDMADAEGLPNLALAPDADQIASGAEVPAIDALAALEEALAGNGEDACGGGVRSMIHANVNTVTIWNYLGLIRNEGGLLLTALDTVVVTGPGYDGSSPSGVIDEDGTSAWAYGTGMVDVRLGRPRRLRYIDRSDNTIEVHAFRPFSVVWDGCCHLGINVNLAERG